MTGHRVSDSRTSGVFLTGVGVVNQGVCGHVLRSGVTVDMAASVNLSMLCPLGCLPSFCENIRAWAKT